MKLWSSQLGTQFLQLSREAWKIQDFNGVWTRDLAIPVRRSNQLSYEVTGIGSWSFVGSNGPVRNESMMKWYMKWIIYELRIWNQVKLWSSQLGTQFLQLRREAWKFQDFNGVWTCDLAIPVRRSNQLNYEATDVGSPGFFRLLYAIAKIAFLTAKFIASLDFISAVHIWFISYTISSWKTLYSFPYRVLLYLSLLSSFYETIYTYGRQIKCCSFFNFMSFIFYFGKKARASSICKRFLFPDSSEPQRLLIPKVTRVATIGTLR